jgi:hypothetical protein
VVDWRTDVASTKTIGSDFPDDLGKWLALAAALVALGFLPAAWKKGISVAAAVVAIASTL